MIISYDDFLKVDIRAGTVIKAELNEKARKPAYKIWVDFGEEIGTLQTSAQITVNYQTEELIGKKVLACVNLGEKNIAGFVSQFLLLGFSDPNGNILLANTDEETPNGERLH